MAWINATVDFNGVTYLSHRRGIIFVVPHCSGLEVGDIFKADSSQFEVLTAVDLHDRGETLVRTDPGLGLISGLLRFCPHFVLHLHTISKLPSS